ncbi:MAG: hypothetical protein EA399_04165 [Desulfovibrionales bacterium]|nr:MAG: hypothetical protein EA399_04165 [Desulfovibrionales bacterium]
MYNSSLKKVNHSAGLQAFCMHRFFPSPIPIRPFAWLKGSQPAFAKETTGCPWLSIKKRA